MHCQVFFVADKVPYLIFGVYFIVFAIILEQIWRGLRFVRYVGVTYKTKTQINLLGLRVFSRVRSLHCSFRVY